MLRVFLAGALALAWLSIADAQTYPSPHFNNVTIDGKVNSLSLPTSDFVGKTDAQTLTNKQIDASEITSGVIGYGFLPIGTTANTVAAGNDSRILGALQTTGGTMTGAISSNLGAGIPGLGVSGNSSGAIYGIDVVNSGSGSATAFNAFANGLSGPNGVGAGQAPDGSGFFYVQGHSYDFDKNGNLTGATNLATISSLAPIATSGSASDLSSGTLATARLPPALLSSTTIPSPIITHSLADNLTSAGSTQGTALLVTQSISAFTSVSLGTGAILPTTDPSGASISAGYVIEILNAGANSLLVYPPSGQSIEGQGANNPVTVAAGGDVRFIYRGSVSGAGAWYAR